MNRYSKKRQKLNREYSKKSKAFLADRQDCEIRSPRCTGATQGVHHTRGRGIHLINECTWIPACNSCNLYVEDNHEWGVNNGFKKSRLAII